jgi:hypothetical protein
VHDERDLAHGLEGKIEPAVESKRVEAREAVDLRLTLGGQPQALSMTFLDRLDSNDSALERSIWTEKRTIHVFEYRRIGITRTNRLANRMTNPPEFVATGGAVALQPVAVARKSPRRLFWERFSQDKAALAGGVVIVLLIFIAIFGGPLASNISGHPQNTTYENMTDAYGVPKGPNSQFWFGADASGRDLFVRTMYGARTSRPASLC